MVVNCAHHIFRRARYSHTIVNIIWTVKNTHITKISVIYVTKDFFLLSFHEVAKAWKVPILGKRSLSPIIYIPKLTRYRKYQRIIQIQRNMATIKVIFFIPHTCAPTIMLTLRSIYAPKRRSIIQKNIFTNFQKLLSEKKSLFQKFIFSWRIYFKLSCSINI